MQTGAPDKCYKILIWAARIEALGVKYLCVWAASHKPCKAGKQSKGKEVQSVVLDSEFEPHQTSGRASHRGDTELLCCLRPAVAFKLATFLALFLPLCL